MAVELNASMRKTFAFFGNFFTNRKPTEKTLVEKIAPGLLAALTKLRERVPGMFDDNLVEFTPADKFVVFKTKVRHDPVGELMLCIVVTPEGAAIFLYRQDRSHAPGRPSPIYVHGLTHGPFKDPTSNARAVLNALCSVAREQGFFARDVTRHYNSNRTSTPTFS